MRAIAKAIDRRTDSPIAWNDVEALPVYAALLIGFGIICLFVADLSSPIETMALKVVGILGCLALRQAWIQLDADDAANTA